MVGINRSGIGRQCAVVLAAALLVPISEAQPKGLLSDPDPEVSHVAPSPEEREVITWARTRFALVGLDVGSVDMSFHDDTEPCGGADGLYRHDTDATVVRVCVPDRGTAASDLDRKRTLVHELAHAWEQANLDDADRTRLLEVLGADAWYAPEAAWDQRGAERFAETIVWGLYDQVRRPTLIDASCRELHADFHTITGRHAPGPLASACGL